MKNSLTERSLTKAEADKSEEIVKKLKGNKKDFVKRYGKDAEAVMYGRAVNMAKKQVENMENNKLKEMIKNALSKPQVEGKKEDMDKDGDIDSKDYLLKRDQAIKKAKEKVKEGNLGHNEMWSLEPEGPYWILTYTTINGKKEKVFKSEEEAKTWIKSNLNEDLDLGHTDNEPHMIKGELYQISKDALDLYDMVSDYEGRGEVDFPAWWQSKITTAKNMMAGARNYLEFELEEPNIDNNISFIDDSEMLDEVGKGYFKKEFGIGKKSPTKEEIKEIAKKMSEGSYPWEECVSDQTSKYGKEGAKKVCGAIKAAYGE